MGYYRRGMYPHKREEVRRCPKCGRPLIRSEYESPDTDTRYDYWCPYCAIKATEQASRERISENIKKMANVLDFYYKHRYIIENFDNLPTNEKLKIADKKYYVETPRFVWAEEKDVHSKYELDILDKVENFLDKLYRIRNSDEFIRYKANEEALLILKHGTVVLMGNPYDYPPKPDEEVPLNYDSLYAYYWQLLAFKGRKYAIEFLKALAQHNVECAKRLLSRVLNE